MAFVSFGIGVALCAAGLWCLVGLWLRVRRSACVPAEVKSLVPVHSKSKHSFFLEMEFCHEGKRLHGVTGEDVNCPSLSAKNEEALLEKWQARKLHVLYDPKHPTRLLLKERLPATAALYAVIFVLGAAVLALVLL